MIFKEKEEMLYKNIQVYKTHMLELERRKWHSKGKLWWVSQSEKSFVGITWSSGGG